MEVLVKYNIDGKFVEYTDYNIRFDIDKVLPIWTLEQVPEDNYRIIESFDSKIIKMTYRGVSKVDSMNLFVINIKENLRNLKLEQVLNFK
jgi:hypothetical protein